MSTSTRDARITGLPVPMLVPDSGSVYVLLVGEAPGPRGADKSGFPFFGDAAGKHLYQVLARMGAVTLPETLATLPWDGARFREAALRPIAHGVALGNAYDRCPTDDGIAFRTPTRAELEGPTNVKRLADELTRLHARGLRGIVTLGRVATRTMDVVLAQFPMPTLVCVAVPHPSAQGLLSMAPDRGKGARMADLQDAWMSLCRERIVEAGFPMVVGETNAVNERTARFDALELTVFSQSVAMLAEEMGTLLERSAISPNIRERRDASCALFDADGRMVAQAAHIPVHLGAMPESVAAVRAVGAAPGDCFLLNDPSHGGSHLPDLTMVEVIPDAADPSRIIGYAAVRAHHADVGGISPGSMPFGATELFQEGLIVPPVRIERDGVPQDDVMRLVLANVRTPSEREGDLRAQRAACKSGREGWQALYARLGAPLLNEAVDALLDYTERRVRARLAQLNGARGQAADALEGDGVTDASIPVVISARIDEATLFLDLTGTSPAVRGNVNAPPAVARAAAVFVLRVLCDDDVPVNDGVARALRLTIPDDCVANARRPSAVAAGNVELSQRITDVCFAALANAAAAVGVHDLPIPACGQGTMNNVTMGAPGWSFYETLGGGQGASVRGNGPDAVHVGMSNTRNTPVESLERAYPLRVVEYAVRRGSGGAGLHRGGDGVVRRYQALTECTATLLTERRRVAPPGANGGASGQPGVNQLNGVVLPAKCRITMQPGDVLTIETPGGGAGASARQLAERADSRCADPSSTPGCPFESR